MRCRVLRQVLQRQPRRSQRFTFNKAYLLTRSFSSIEKERTRPTVANESTNRRGKDDDVADKQGCVKDPIELEHFKSQSDRSSDGVAAGEKKEGDGENTKDGENKHEDNSNFTLYASFFASLASYWAFAYYQRNKLERICEKEAISPTKDELDDLIQDTNLDTADIMTIKACLHFLAPAGVLQPDHFGAFMQNTVQRIKQEKKTKRLLEIEKAEQEMNLDNEEVAESEEEEIFLDLPYMKDSEQEQAKDWEFVAAFRLSTLDDNKRVDLDEIFTFLAALVEDMKPREEWEYVKGMTRDRLRKINKNRWTKLERAWDFACKDTTGILSHAELTALFGRMMRVGFYDEQNLLYKSQTLPPGYSILQPSMIADKYFSELGKDCSTHGLSWKEFMNVTESIRLADVDDCPKFWFLKDKRTGFFKGLQIKWTERYQRWSHHNGRESNPLLEIDPATIGYNPQEYSKSKPAPTQTPVHVENIDIEPHEDNDAEYEYYDDDDDEEPSK